MSASHDCINVEEGSHYCDDVIEVISVVEKKSSNPLQEVSDKPD